MDAKEFLKIKNEECRKNSICCRKPCAFFDAVERHCSVGGDYTGSKDPVAIAEEIKRKQEEEAKKPRLPRKISYGVSYGDIVDDGRRDDTTGRDTVLRSAYVRLWIL